MTTEPPSQASIEDVARRNGKWTLANFIISAFLLLMIGWMTFITNQILDLRAFAARGDRFTIVDGHGLKEWTRAEIARMEIPPPWFLAEVRGLRDEVKAHEKRLDAIDVAHGGKAKR